MNSVRFSKASYVAAFLLGALIALLLARPTHGAAIAAINPVAVTAESVDVR